MKQQILDRNELLRFSFGPLGFMVFQDWTRVKPIRAKHRPGRNELCSCGSKEKYKKCCWKG